MKNRSPQLDFLRILAALWVVSFHWSGGGAFYGHLNFPYELNWWPKWLVPISNIGFLGVDVFFILSGSVIAKSALRSTARKFGVSRFLRLYPVYFLATIFALLIAPHSIRSFHANFSSYMANLIGANFILGGPIVGAAWTLTYEIGFYLIIYSALRYFEFRKREFGEEQLIQTLLVLILLSIFGSLTFDLLKVQSPTALLGPKFIPYFVLGSCLTFKITLTNMRLLIVFLLSVYLTGSEIINRMPFTKHQFLHGLIFLIIVISIVHSSLFLRIDFLSRRTTKAITTLSLMTYAVYLLHETVGISLISLLINRGFSIQWTHCFVFGAILIVSWLSTKFYEPAFRRLFNRYLFSKSE